VSAEESELPAGLGGQATPVTRSDVSRRAVDQAADVAVSEAGRCEFPTRDGVEQSEVGWVVQAQGAETATVLDHRTRDGIEELRAGRGVLHGREGVQVRVVGALGQLSTTMEIGDTLAEGTPLELALGFVVRRPEDFEVLRPCDGGLDAQDAAGRVEGWRGTP
jgi:hypothetical protein